MLDPKQTAGFVGQELPRFVPTCSKAGPKSWPFGKGIHVRGAGGMISTHPDGKQRETHHLQSFTASLVYILPPSGREANQVPVQVALWARRGVLAAILR